LFTKNVLILIKNGLGFILGGFFTNSSGHPGFEFLKLSSNTAKQRSVTRSKL
jgi:hypothetical protein